MDDMGGGRGRVGKKHMKIRGVGYFLQVVLNTFDLDCSETLISKISFKKLKNTVSTF